MICEDCQSAGEENAKGDEVLAAVFHGKCRGGTWCDCHHYTGGGWTADELPNASVESVVELAAPREPIRESGVSSYAIPG